MALEQKDFPSTQESRVGITTSREIRGQNGPSSSRHKELANKESHLGT